MESLLCSLYTIEYNVQCNNVTFNDEYYLITNLLLMWLITNVKQCQSFSS